MLSSSNTGLEGKREKDAVTLMFSFALQPSWVRGNASCHAGRPLQFTACKLETFDWGKKDNFLANASAMIAEEKLAHYHHDSRAVLPKCLRWWLAFPPWQRMQLISERRQTTLLLQPLWLEAWIESCWELSRKTLWTICRTRMINM